MNTCSIVNALCEALCEGPRKKREKGIIGGEIEGEKDVTEL